MILDGQTNYYQNFTSISRCCTDKYHYLRFIICFVIFCF
jgi:hypothetical protein